MIADEPLLAKSNPVIAPDAYVVAIRPHQEHAFIPHFPMHIEIADTPLMKLVRPMPDEITWADPVGGMSIGVATSSGGDGFMTWMPHETNLMLGYLMSPNKAYEKVQYRAFLRLCWQLSELRRLGHINFTAPPPFDGSGETS